MLAVGDALSRRVAPLACQCPGEGSLRRWEYPGGIVREDPLRSGSEVVIKDGPLRGFAMIERRRTARQRVRPPVDVVQRQTRVALSEQWARQS